eukprot:scaffold11833_cov91-Skeletonema_dohrnii-CCMP3373.AAC.2
MSLSSERSNRAILLQYYTSASIHDTNATGDDQFIVAGYLPDYRSYMNINATSLHLTDVMLFSLTPEAVLHYSESSSAGCCLSEEHFTLLRKARSHKHLEQTKSRLRLLITIGGGGEVTDLETLLPAAPVPNISFYRD